MPSAGNSTEVPFPADPDGQSHFARDQGRRLTGGARGNELWARQQLLDGGRAATGAIA